MTSDNPEDDELFELFRGLRERTFEGSTAFVMGVLRGLKRQLEAPPEESLALTLLVQLLNLLTSSLGADNASKPGGGRDVDS
ncbi:MAG: hypothetical protein MUF34_11345 [Polyangiaceae bacterium]|jgi:hypothetical protein|nr:hypothetical protein [Polyangiaceae bacterium]